MSRDIKYQVFVSSTFEDLQDERRRLMEQILNLGHIPVGMELFKAANEEQWSYIKKRILSCDYYLLIVAERYGSLDSHGKSYTQKEYEFAVANKIPVAAFLLDNEARKDRKAKFVEHARRAEIDAFRALCSAKRMVTFWTDANDLALRATNALLDLIREEPRQGWVRADQSADAALRELAKLAEEKRELEEKLSVVAQTPLTAPPDVSYHLEKLSSLNVTSSWSDSDLEKIDEFTSHDLIDIFIKVSRGFASGISEWEALRRIYEYCKIKTTRNTNEFSFGQEILDEFMAYGLIKVAYTATNSTSTRRMCSITDYGLKLLMYAELEQEKIWTEDVEEPVVTVQKPIKI